jgi:hypothetical protein
VVRWRLKTAFRSKPLLVFQLEDLITQNQHMESILRLYIKISKFKIPLKGWHNLIATKHHPRPLLSNNKEVAQKRQWPPITFHPAKTLHLELTPLKWLKLDLKVSMKSKIVTKPYTKRRTIGNILKTYRDKNMGLSCHIADRRSRHACLKEA